MQALFGGKKTYADPVVDETKWNTAFAQLKTHFQGLDGLKQTILAQDTQLRACHTAAMSTASHFIKMLLTPEIEETQLAVQEAAQHTGGASANLLTDCIVVLEDLLSEIVPVEKYVSLRHQMKEEYFQLHRKHLKSLDQTDASKVSSCIQRP